MDPFNANQQFMNSQPEVFFLYICGTRLGIFFAFVKVRSLYATCTGPDHGYLLSIMFILDIKDKLGLIP